MLFGDAAAVDRHPDASQDRDAERPADSGLVSEIAEAEPARSGGALPRMMSFVRVNTGESPSE